MTEEEIQYAIQGKPDWVKEIINENTRKFSLRTLQLITDISIYLGETIIANNSCMHWGYLTKPKSLYGVNRPRLVDDKGKISVYTLNLVSVCTRKSAEIPNKYKLYETYHKWVGNIHKFYPNEDVKNNL